MADDFADRMNDYAQQLMAYKSGEMVSLMIHIGDELGLYDAMAGKEAVTAETLAEATGFNERWLLEWLRGQGAAGIIDHLGSERFQLSDVASVALLNADSPAYLRGFFFAPPSHEILDKTIDAFRTGIGVSWGAHGDGASHFLCRTNRPFHLQLASGVIPLMGDTAERLSAGGNVLDVGCGSGTALTELAKAFPNASFLGIDPAGNMIEEANARYAAMDNVRFEVGYGERIEEKDTYDLVTTFDCMHDMTDPHGTMRAVRSAVKEGGAWLIKDIRSQDTYEQNLENPVASMMYGFSVLYCMSSALSTPGGAGLGTLGFPPSVCERMGREAGFGQFRVLEYENDPFNNYYELRP
ncbi:MAG: methyltransferase domain-containing protein [Pseudomonadales bacterium]|nr:methyltransferase domain-containing protein [Pseudomonadales bacterium]MDP6471559.1 methyltransferase domain-containing protein [Pseudomonadales bacterium]MDP6828822.1 methyltransferase domain-containing protein [Pseudomonadales bacterium]MDP6970670.1 methyltransferase domain-containing protein [Pseudomonadales bacterium]